MQFLLGRVTEKNPARITRAGQKHETFLFYFAMFTYILQETFSAFRPAADAELPAVSDDLLVPCAPVVPGQNVHQLELGLYRVVCMRDAEEL